MSSSVKINVENGEDLMKEIGERIEVAEYEVTVNFPLNQNLLERLAASVLGRLISVLVISPEEPEDYEDDNPPVIDFSKVVLPKIRRLDIQYQSVKAADFTTDNTPLLEHLIIELPPNRSLEYFNLSLPELRSINFQFIDIQDPRGFGKSLSSCPKLSSFSSYKLWGLSVRKRETHILMLPCCESLDLYRSDDLNYLKIWAPRLENLNLQACYDISNVSLLDQKVDGYSGPQYEFSGTPSQFTVNCMNTSRPKGNITTHARCSQVLCNMDSESDMFGAGRFGDVDSGDSDDDTDYDSDVALEEAAFYAILAAHPPGWLGL